MIVKLRLIFLFAAFTLIWLTVGYGKQDRTDTVVQDKSGVAYTTKDMPPLKDKPLATYQNELIDLAFETASAIPIKPHIKDRSRTQEEVVVASLKLDQPRRALRFIEKIDNWRRGSAYGDLAFYCARQGYTNEVQKYLKLADQVAEVTEGWRRDQIRVKIAKTYTWLGQDQQAEQFEADVVDSESGKVVGVKVMIADENYFGEQMEALDSLIASGNFDIIKNALKSYTRLFNRFYYDVERRSLVEEKIKTSWGKLPIITRIELLMELAGFALDNADQAKALELVKETQLLMDEAKWPPEYYIKLKAKLVELQFRAGNEQKARINADSLRTFFNSQKSKIMNIYRAGTLRPLAEAYQSMGNTTAALEVYKRVIEEGVENPNSRPRAEDLSATCISMALHRLEPDFELWTRIHQINKELGDPW